MTNDEYQALALRTEFTPPMTVNGQDFNGKLLHGMIGICTEAGELQDMVKKHLIYGKPLDLVNVLEECGDVLWYLALTLHSAGYTMDQAMERNIAKLLKRFPDKFTATQAINRDLAAERAELEK